MKMHDPKIVVCGATRNQGGSVAAALLRSRRWSVTALTRDVGSDAAKALAAAGAEVLQANLNDMASLRQAFRGADGVFAVTQPWSYERGIFDTEAEIRQGKNIIWACIEAGVPGIVYSSLINVGGSRSGVPWIDSKLLLEQLFRDHLPGTMIIRPALYMENIGTQLLNISGRTLKGRFGPDARVPYVALRYIGALAARLFDAPDHYRGTTQVLAGDVAAGEDIASILSGLAGGPGFQYKGQTGLALRLFKPRFFDMRRFFELQGRLLAGHNDSGATYPKLPEEPLFLKAYLRTAACGLLQPG